MRTDCERAISRDWVARSQLVVFFDLLQEVLVTQTYRIDSEALVTVCTGNILDDKSDAIVIPVNTVGVMGAGLARQAKVAIPGLFAAYREACQPPIDIDVGLVWYYQNCNVRDNQVIACLPTKEHWSNGSELRWVEWGLNDLARNAFDYGLTSVAIPPLGCGLGGLDWRDVEPMIYSAFHNRSCRVNLYAPARY